MSTVERIGVGVIIENPIGRLVFQMGFHIGHQHVGIDIVALAVSPRYFTR